MSTILNNTRTVKDVVTAHKAAVANLYRSFERDFRNLGSTFWKNRNYAPEQLAAEYGTECVELFRLSGLAGQLIYDANGTVVNIVPPTKEFTVNSDGTVTITDKPTPELET